MAVSSGDSECDLVYWRHRIHEFAHGLIGHSVSSRADTSDVTQEALLQFWKHKTSERGVEQPQESGLARSMARGHAAKLRRFHTADRRDARKSSGYVAQGDNQLSPPAEVSRHEQLQRLAAAVQQLDEVEQQVVFCYYFDDLSFRLISHKLNITEKVARGVCSRALKHLASTMAE